jgi:hypothetical protein
MAIPFRRSSSAQSGALHRKKNCDTFLRSCGNFGIFVALHLQTL